MKFLTIFTFIIFIFSNVCSRMVFGETLKLIGKLGVAGSSFDSFTVNGEDDYYEIDKSNPNIKKIYDVCSYDTNCEILAKIDDGQIVDILKIRNLEKDNNVTDTSERVIGPKIFDLYLNMNLNQLNEALKNLCNKYNLHIAKKNSNANFIDLVGSNEDLYASITLDKTGNYVVNLQLNARLFNQSNLINKQFIQELKKQYNLDTLRCYEEYNNIWNYTDVKCNYQKPDEYSLEITRSALFLQRLTPSPPPRFN